MTIRKVEAAAIFFGTGWLSRQPPSFRTEVIERGHVEDFAPGDIVYRIGDVSGGIYGLMKGVLAISFAVTHGPPRFVQFGIAGAWAGEGPFLTGEPRRVEMRATTACTLFYLPIEAMQQMAARDPEAIRCFARITIGHFDILSRVINDLLISRADRRIASVLQRASELQAKTIPISQSALGEMANASRKQVNAALARFEKEGWISHNYRSIEVLDGAALFRYAQSNET
ncbi:Crp/Fnr family transcriptional regulator [Kaistia algarum]|uniref:Crp/Fnr family transcriptional regulator n=1 Tax=Kaistia algarum TaxID=2083279 RepID=UPI000CE7E121|nr:Crp/Fnr family transcriptional regulator [Kaistia algarum]MCX5515757.1 Crp/Fnr family transcriptional regulator [Kaistia algarum]PPE80868.1 Crp/Fnr family transcriptional regulator [Kaistia algarum]